ncbi:MAG TPA: IS1595 family transposase [Candidatus Angelobacter sp.]|jgi:transposase-like protein|nr:IS1595 family transposase [Candidatus Angelobacter sp.]
MERKIKTLQEAIKQFSDEQTCIDTVANLVWPDGKPICPKCGGKDHYWLATQKRWKCKNGKCGKQFSVKVNTIFEDSPLGLDKWLMAMWMLANCKNGVSSWEIHRAIGITQKSAWFMMHRIRLAMYNGTISKLTGQCEADETFIGGKARNMHKSVKARRIHGSGTKDKTVIMGILQRGDDCKPKDRENHSKVIAMAIPNNKRKHIHGEIKKHVEAGSALYSDALMSYVGLDADYAHQVVDHAVEYVRGKVHTNGMENFWSLTDRTISGTYVSVEPFHLFRYLDEQSFRFNNRGTRKMPVDDGDRFLMVLSQVAGKRIMYDQLTGKEGVSREVF